jgi:hypothetical protein
MKRKGKVKIAAIAGIGNLKFINFIEKNAAIGKRNVPNTVMILKEI